MLYVVIMEGGLIIGLLFIIASLKKEVSDLDFDLIDATLEAEQLRHSRERAHKLEEELRRTQNELRSNKESLLNAWAKVNVLETQMNGGR